MFKAIKIRILTKLGKRIDELNEDFNKELENIKRNRAEKYNNWNEKYTSENSQHIKWHRRVHKQSER